MAYNSELATKIAQAAAKLLQRRLKHMCYNGIAMSTLYDVAEKLGVVESIPFENPKLCMITMGDRARRPKKGHARTMAVAWHRMFDYDPFGSKEKSCVKSR